MIAFRPLLLTAALASVIGLSACGGDDDADATDAASKSLQEQGVEQQDADELAATAQRLKDEGFTEEDGKKLQASTAATQRKVQGLQQRIVALTKQVQAGDLSTAEGTKQINALSVQIQREALRTAEELEQAGALPESAKQAVEEARKRLKDAQAK
jgi:hypothetical protein